MHTFVGEKSNDPQSPAYVPSIFDSTKEHFSGPRVAQMLRRYEAVKRRQQKKDELEAAESLRLILVESSSPGDSDTLGLSEIATEDTDQNGPTSQEYKALQVDHKALQEDHKALQEDHKALQEDHKALQEDYRARVYELRQQPDSLVGRGIPSETMLKEDNKLTSFYTGLPSFAVFLSIFNFVVKSIQPTSNNGKLTNFQCFLMTLMKLRLNLSNYDLGFRFCVHDTTVSRIIIKWVQFMDVRLSPLIHWPEREQLQKTMPWCFRSHYGLKVTSIIDCFELFIEKPCDLMSKAVTWSTYKHHNTVKYLVSITPQGTVSFISKGYGGRASDKYITENCGYLKKLFPGDVVLADRGFNVEDSVAYRGATLNIPASLRASLSSLQEMLKQHAGLPM